MSLASRKVFRRRFIRFRKGVVGVLARMAKHSLWWMSRVLAIGVSLAGIVYFADYFRDSIPLLRWSPAVGQVEMVLGTLLARRLPSLPLHWQSRCS